MVLSCHITSAWLMRMRQAKNHYDPLLRTQFTLNFPMKCDVNTNILKFSSESRKSYGTNTHLISCHIRLHVHDLCACVIPKSTTTRFVEHNLSSIFRRNMLKETPQISKSSSESRNRYGINAHYIALSHPVIYI